MEYEKLPVKERVSESYGRPKSAEEARKIARIKTGVFRGKKRVGIYRNGKKVAVLEIKDDVGDEEIQSVIKSEIAEGKFDRELVDVYRDTYRQQREKRRARRKNDAETERQL